MVAEITAQDFDGEVLQCDLPVFACFTGPRCGYCFPTCMCAGVVSEEYHGRVKFIRVDVEKCAGLAERYAISVLPTIALFRDSQMVKRLIGYQEKRSLRHVLDALLGEGPRQGLAISFRRNSGW